MESNEKKEDPNPQKRYVGKCRYLTFFGYDPAGWAFRFFRFVLMSGPIPNSLGPAVPHLATRRLWARASL